MCVRSRVLLCLIQTTVPQRFLGTNSCSMYHCQLTCCWPCVSLLEVSVSTWCSWCRRLDIQLLLLVAAILAAACKKMLYWQASVGQDKGAPLYRQLQASVRWIRAPRFLPGSITNTLYLCACQVLLEFAIDVLLLLEGALCLF